MKSRIHPADNIPFEEPINIKCVVGDKKLFAKVTAQTNDPVQTGFFVEFSDGTNIVATGCEDSGKFEADSPLYARYIDAIQKELTGFSMVMDSDWYKFEIKYKHENILVWVSVKDEQDYNYKIYFDGTYKFELKEYLYKPFIRYAYQ